ncbi:unnamed protein product [Toxocara canis]|uniref:Calponin-homology (CH) domain-containing protein n=1 Tax=Toxocara canis TaxID=6265 RepID=A0A183VFG9_TOXCA|nr:unnamed protein product [Toxocara canis]
MLQFLYIVEVARKEDELAERRPRLFVRSSSVKSMADVLAELSREVISGSSLPKALARIGFKSEYSQGFFEEFQYVVNNFAVDLADGVILGKAVELVAGLEPNSVVGCLRNPSGDRLRKIKNVNEVLSAAKRHGIDTGDVKAESIVQGRTDDILEFVWRLVGVFASMYRPAAETMQSAELLLHVYRQMAERSAITEKIMRLAGKHTHYRRMLGF